jgi:hypothetical protein
VACYWLGTSWACLLDVILYFLGLHASTAWISVDLLLLLFLPSSPDLWPNDDKSLVITALCVSWVCCCIKEKSNGSVPGNWYTYF